MQISINGSLVAFATHNVSDQLDQRSTLNMTVIGTVSQGFAKGDQVVAYDEVNQIRVFAGLIDTATVFVPNALSSVAIWTIACVDNHAYVDRRTVAKAYANELAGDIIGDLITNYLATEGIVGTRAQPTFTRASAAYNANGTLATSGTQRFETTGGITGGVIEEGTTNLLSANQSSVETDTTGFAAQGSGVTISRDTTIFWSGAASLKAICDGTAANQGVTVTLASGSYTNGETITLSFYVKGSGTNLRAYCWQQSPDAMIGSAVTFTPSGASWTRVTITATLPNPLIATNYGIRVDTNGTQAATFYLDGCQIEAKAYATRWQIGGTPRADESFTIPTANIIQAAQGVIAARVYVTNDILSAANDRYVFYTGAASDKGRISLFHTGGASNWTVKSSDNTSGPNYTTFTVSDSWTPTGWHTLCVRWNTNEISLWIDGVKQGSAATPYLPATPGTNITIGAGASGGQANTLIGAFQTTYFARGDAQMAALTVPAYDDDSTYFVGFQNSSAGQSTIFDGVTVASAVINYATAADAINATAQKCDYYWLVDSWKVLKFGPRDARRSPFTVQSGAAAVLAGTANMLDGTIKRTSTAPQYRNTEYLLGGSDTTTLQTEIQAGDGSKQTFPLGFPLSAVPTISVSLSGGGYVTKTVGIKGVDTGKDWYWQANDSNIYQDSGATKLTSADKVQVQYYGLFPVVIYASDSAGIAMRQMVEGGSGIVEVAEVAPADVTTRAAGYQIANSKLQRYGVIAAQLEFETYAAGLRAGQLLTATVPEYGISGEVFLIQSVEISNPNATQIKYKVTAIDGPASGSWIEFFQVLTSKQVLIDQLQIGSSGILITVVPESESWTWSETVTESVFTCPIVGSATCSGTTIVC